MCRKEQGMKKTKELILRAVEKTAQKINIVGNQTLAERNPYRYRSYYYEKAMSFTRNVISITIK